MKTLQKGFSLVELLVVVAIIGVLAGVGIVGYQGYTDSAKERVAIANFNSVKRFVETELTLLNNNIQTTSAAINAFNANCAGTTTSFDNTANNAANNLGAFLQGIQCYFEITDGYGSAFKNPYDAQTAQVVYNVTPGSLTKGSINISLITAAEVAAATRAGAALVAGQDDAATVTSAGDFIVTYAPAAGSEGTAGEQKGKVFTLE